MSNTTALRVIACTSPTELFRHYDGQTEAQDAYIELDLANGTLLADYNGEIGNAVPFTVYHGIDRRYAIPILTGDAANRVMEEIRPLAERILADSEIEWDGNNNVAKLGPDALAAEEALEARLGLPTESGGYRNEPNQGFDDSDLVAVWGIDGATNGCEAEEYGITRETTDERLDEIEAEILAGLVSCGDSDVAVCPELSAYLRGVRDEAGADEDDEDED
ncbi:hypothetical protein [Streptomyces hirsutus]|uniref:hypothetical protein n=1 Tax=Streptomyces hirsutus TaxID=35620 RepID=UPI003329D992